MTSLRSAVEAHPIESVLLASLAGAVFGFFGLPKGKEGTSAKNVPMAVAALILEAAADRIKDA